MDDAITLEAVTKHFRKRTIKPQYTTIKSQLVQWLRPRKKALPPSPFIEALKGVDLRIPKGRTVGIVGRNGSGKSTLLKLMTGIYSPTSGNVKVNGRISALLDLGAGFHPDFSGRENIHINGIILGMSSREVRERVDTIIEFAELGDFIDEPVRTYSSGMFMRLAFAVATHVDPDVLIIDEILAVGDEHFTKKSSAKMNEFKRSGKTIVLVTHDLHTIQTWCDMAAWLDGGKARLVGEPSFVVDQYRRAVAAAEAQSAATGHSALSSPGNTLPDVPSDAPRPISTVRLGEARLEPSGSQGISPACSADLCVDFSTTARVEDVTFCLKVKRAAGADVFVLRAQPKDLGVDALQGEGQLRLHLPRLSLAPGRYCVDVTAQSAAGFVYDSLSSVAGFDVPGSDGGGALVVPAHEWSVLPRSTRVLPAASQGR